MASPPHQVQMQPMGQQQQHGIQFGSNILQSNQPMQQQPQYIVNNQPMQQQQQFMPQQQIVVQQPPHAQNLPIAQPVQQVQPQQGQQMRLVVQLPPHHIQLMQQREAEVQSSAEHWQRVQSKRQKNQNPLFKRFEKIEFTSFLIIELFKVTMACLLSLFVPQQCPPTDSNPSSHECEMKENFTDLTSFNKFVLAWNFITLGALVLNYFVIYKRENFLVDKLEADPKFSRVNLPEVFKHTKGQYERIEMRLKFYNQWLFGTSVVVIIFMIVNVIVSGVLIFRDYYYGYKSVTVFLTNLALVAQLIKKNFENGYEGVFNSLALSCIELEPQSFNTIDPDYVVDLGVHH